MISRSKNSDQGDRGDQRERGEQPVAQSIAHTDEIERPSDTAHTERVDDPTTIESTIRSVWAEILDRSEIGPDDHFFRLGGDSLAAVRATAQVATRLGWEFPLELIFQASTPRTLAEILGDPALRSDGEAMSGIMPADLDSSHFLSTVQESTWRRARQLGGEFNNMPFAVRIRMRVEIEVLKRCIDEISQRHAMLRTTIHELNGRPVQKVSDQSNFCFEVSDLPFSSEPQIQEAITALMPQEATRVFDLERGPLLRFTLLRISEDDYVMIFTVHHLIFDGSSMVIFLNEIFTLYPAFLAGRPSPLTPLKLQFVDFVAAEQERLSPSFVKRAISYWRRQLGDNPAPLALPLEMDIDQAEGIEGGGVEFRWPQRLTENIQELTQREDITLFVALLAMFQATLHAVTPQEHVTVSTNMANRLHADFQGLIGMFITGAPIRSQVGDDPSFSMLMQRTRRAVIGYYAVQDLPFEKVTEEVGPQLKSLFRVFFLLQEGSLGSGTGIASTLEVLETPLPVSRHVLSLHIRQDGGELHGRLQYRTSLLKHETVSYLSDTLLYIAEAATEDSSLQLSALREIASSRIQSRRP